MMTMMSLSIANALPVTLQVDIVDPEDTQDNPQRGPVFCPNVDLDGHTLYLYNIGYSFTLALRDENDNYVYVTNVPAGSTSIVLPSDLSGDYTLVLYPGGDYYFEGEITL